MILRLFLLFLLLFASSAHAAKWREVGEVSETGTIVSVDDGSLSVDHDSIVTGWVRFEYAKPQERDGHKLTGYVSQRMVNCEINRYWVMDSWGYPSNNAEPVRLYSADQEWQMPPPDSEAEIASAALCNETLSFMGIGFEIFSRLQTVWSILKSTIAR
jgi:hypothetical protein